MDAFSVAAPRKYTGSVKRFNQDGFSNMIEKEWITQLTLIVGTEIESISETSIQLGIKNSELIANEIVEDSSLSIRTKIAFALIASITQSAMRMRAIIRKVPEGDFRRTLMPIMSKIGQAGMQTIHTPAHYQSAFPAISLIGRIAVVAKRLKNEIEGVTADDGDAKIIEKFDIKVETDNNCSEEVLKRFPATIMFPGLGGIFMMEDFQAYHRDWSEHYFNNVVSGTNYEDGWYSLTAADMHPWIKLKMLLSEKEDLYESIGFELVKDAKMKLEDLWEMLELLTCFFLKKIIKIEMPAMCAVELYR
jgi:hypothetical protein